MSAGELFLSNYFASIAASAVEGAVRGCSSVLVFNSARCHCTSILQLLVEWEAGASVQKYQTSVQGKLGAAPEHS